MESTYSIHGWFEIVLQVKALFLSSSCVLKGTGHRQLGARLGATSGGLGSTAPTRVLKLPDVTMGD